MFVILLLFIFIPLNVHSYEISLKTLLEGKPLPHTDVKIFKKSAVIKFDAPTFFYKSDKDGQLNLNLESGDYYFFAEKRENGNNFFGFYGLNPLTLRTDQHISINLVRYPDNFVNVTKTVNRIDGKVMYNDKPVQNVVVFAYLDALSDFKGPAYAMATTDEKGLFSIDLSAGSYYLFFRKRNKEMFGPPLPGDYVGLFPIFPLVINQNGYEIKVNLLKIPEKMSSNIKGKSYQLKGKVVNKKNVPIAGVYVVLYEDYSILGKPDYVSHKTDKNGEFVIYVKKAGTYYVVLRKTLGDTPQINENVVSFSEVTLNDDVVTKEIKITLDE